MIKFSPIAISKSPIRCPISHALSPCSLTLSTLFNKPCNFCASNPFPILICWHGLPWEISPEAHNGLFKPILFLNVLALGSFSLRSSNSHCREWTSRHIITYNTCLTLPCGLISSLNFCSFIVLFLINPWMLLSYNKTTIIMSYTNNLEINISLILYLNIIILSLFILDLEYFQT